MDKIKVGGLTYEVKDVEGLTHDSAEAYGVCKTGELVIEMNKKYKGQRYNQTLIHEIMHAVFDEAGLEDDEDVVNRLSLVWYQVLKENDFSFLKDKPKVMMRRSDGLMEELK